MTEKQLLALLDKYAPAIRDAILSGIRDIRDNARLGDIIRMIEANNVDGALRALGYNPAVFNAYYLTMLQAFEQGGLMMMASMPRYTDDGTGVKTMLRFNVRDRDAERWLAQQSSQLITNIEEDVRQAVRGTLQDGMARGANPRKVALDLVGRVNPATGHREGGVVGLGEREQMWSIGVRQKLLSLDESYLELKLRDKRFDGIVRKAIADGKPLTAAQVTKLVDRYRERALKHRGDTIGRTEALAALNRSEWESTRQALEQSGLPLAAAQKVWDDAGDSKTRHSHAALGKMAPISIDEPFVSPVTGARMMHPHDTSLIADSKTAAKERVGCRCKARYIIDFLYEYR